ncbi:hypothetical protein X753_07245 [Mesorhizobium sp. LNJC399B00]|nr:hypothetical protein X753_07245 [Mesorhizobium sp. LNJC399B00]
MNTRKLEWTAALTISATLQPLASIAINIAAYKRTVPGKKRSDKFKLTPLPKIDIAGPLAAYCCNWN